MLFIEDKNILTSTKSGASIQMPRFI